MMIGHWNNTAFHLILPYAFRFPKKPSMDLPCPPYMPHHHSQSNNTNIRCRVQLLHL